MTRNGSRGRRGIGWLAVAGAVAGLLAAGAASAAVVPDPGPATEPQTSAAIAPEMNLVVGKSTLLRVPFAVDRISIGNPSVADVTLISPREIYLLGKAAGGTNVIVWSKTAQTTVIDVAVTVDGAALEERLRLLLPGEKDIRVTTASDSVVLSGTVSSGVKADQAVAIAEAYVRNINRGLVLPIVAGDGRAEKGTNITVGDARSVGGAVNAAGSRVVNLMTVAAPQQVMLEVKVAEVSKKLLEKLGAQVFGSHTSGDWTARINSQFLSDSAGLLQALKSTGKIVNVDAEKQDGLIKILAEPNITSVSGQEAAFLAGGKIFIPVARANDLTGGTTITLEEKEFGVGLKFTPTVLDGDRIHLKVAPEVSELSQTGSPFTSINGVTAILPTFTTRRAETSVQLHDGQSFAIAGLIKNNVTETVKRFPFLGEIPVLGALFRSSEFQRDQSELLFVVTPRLVRPLPPNYALPTDNFIEPTRSEFFLGGRMEGSRPSDGSPSAPQRPAPRPSSPAPSPTPSSAPATGGFDAK